MDFKRNKRYFEGVSNAPAIWSYIIGTALLLIGLVLTEEEPEIAPSFLALAFILISGGIFYNIMKCHLIPKDSEIDNSTYAMANEFILRAPSFLGFSDSYVGIANPVLVCGYQYLGAQRGKLGGDGVWRSSRFGVGTVYFSENALHFYRCYYSIIDSDYRDYVDVIPYNEIISVSLVGYNDQFNLRQMSYSALQINTKGRNPIFFAMQDVNSAMNYVRVITDIVNSRRNMYY